MADRKRELRPETVLENKGPQAPVSDEMRNTLAESSEGLFEPLRGHSLGSVRIHASPAAEAGSEQGQSSSMPGMSPEEEAAFSEEITLLLQAAAGQVEDRRKSALESVEQTSWLLVNLPIDERLQKAENINRELAIRFFQVVLSKVGVVLDRNRAERIYTEFPKFIGKGPWRNLTSAETVREKVSALHEKHVPVIGYTSNTESAKDVVHAYYMLIAEEKENVRRAYEALHKSRYAEEAILDFYIAHVNGLTSLLKGIPELAVAPYNLGQSLRGKPGYRLIPEEVDKFLHIEYSSAYGKKHGQTMESGVMFGLILTGPGLLGALRAQMGPLLVQRMGSVMPFVARFLPTGPVAQVILNIARKMLMLASLSGEAQGVVDIAKAVWALKTGIYTREDGKVEPLTEETAAHLIESIIMNTHSLQSTVGDLVKGKPGVAESKPEAPLPEQGVPEVATPPVPVPEAPVPVHPGLEAAVTVPPVPQVVPPVPRAPEAAVPAPPAHPEVLPPVLRSPPEVETPAQTPPPESTPPQLETPPKPAEPHEVPPPPPSVQVPQPDWPGLGTAVHTGAQVASLGALPEMNPQELALFSKVPAPGETKAQVTARRQSAMHAFVQRTYNPKTRTQAELNSDVERRKPAYDNEPVMYAEERARLAADEALRRAEIRLQQLDAAYPEPPTIDIAANDAAYHDQGAHTGERHGSFVPLWIRDALPGEKSIESRVASGEGWNGQESKSFRWLSVDIMNKTLTEHIRSRWDKIKLELALYGAYDGPKNAQGQLRSTPAGEVVGEGFEQVHGPVRPDATSDIVYYFREGTSFTVRIRLIDGTPPRIMILTSFPSP